MSNVERKATLQPSFWEKLFKTACFDASRLTGCCPLSVRSESEYSCITSAGHLVGVLDAKEFILQSMEFVVGMVGCLLTNWMVLGAPLVD
jgi:hypothetical protein